jgi:hypothetical protein
MIRFWIYDFALLNTEGVQNRKSEIESSIHQTTPSVFPSIFSPKCTHLNMNPAFKIGESALVLAFFE